MYDHELAGTHILVPLDGSDLAERALPVAAQVASALKATLVLARITPPLTIPPTEDEMGSMALYQQMVDAEAQAAATYLESVARPLRERGMRVQVVAARGVAAPVLLDLIDSLQIGLIVMTTHGRTGMARLALGSVADALVCNSHVPVLVLRPLIGERYEGRLERAVVPLDGSETAEAALGASAALSGTIIRHITLLRVVPLRAGVASEGEIQEASRYLDGVSAQLSRQLSDRAAVETIETRVLRGDPAEQIIRSTEGSCDLVIMVTHGGPGTRRWVFGSVADRILHDTTTPLVLIQPSPVPASAHAAN